MDSPFISLFFRQVRNRFSESKDSSAFDNMLPFHYLWAQREARTQRRRWFNTAGNPVTVPLGTDRVLQVYMHIELFSDPFMMFLGQKWRKHTLKIMFLDLTAFLV